LRIEQTSGYGHNEQGKNVAPQPRPAARAGALVWQKSRLYRHSFPLDEKSVSLASVNILPAMYVKETCYPAFRPLRMTAENVACSGWLLSCMETVVSLPDLYFLDSHYAAFFLSKK
jgi:hypothetical protein